MLGRQVMSQRPDIHVVTSLLTLSSHQCLHKEQGRATRVCQALLFFSSVCLLLPAVGLGEALSHGPGSPLPFSEHDGAQPGPGTSL